MDECMRLQMLKRPQFPADVILDTDAYNEIDDQFAISYLLRSEPELRVRALTAAPFYNSNSTGPADGMERSYQEILKLLKLAEREELRELVYRGSEKYLPDETTPIESPAAEAIGRIAMEYSPEKPLYVVAIGAITNVASALLKYPEIRERMVVVWLGGHALHWPHTAEFNMMQDVAAARVVFGCGVPVVQLPCMGVVSAFTVSGAELDVWFKGKNALCTYLAEHTREAAEKYAAGTPWTRVIWDVTAVAWLLGERFVEDQLIPTPIPEYDHHYGKDPTAPLMRCAYQIHRDALLTDLVKKLTK